MSLRDKQQADELVAQAAPAELPAATPKSSAAPAQPAVAQQAEHPLASTGLDLAREIVFGAALLLLGVILAVLARVVRSG